MNSYTKPTIKINPESMDKLMREKKESWNFELENLKNTVHENTLELPSTVPKEIQESIKENVIFMKKRRVKLEYIKDKRRRDVVFIKRKQDIVRKVKELVTLTNCELMFVCEPRGGVRLFDVTTKKYEKCVEDIRNDF